MNQAVQPERRPDQQITNMNNLKRLVSPSTPYDPPEGAIRGPATGRLRHDSTKSSVSAGNRARSPTPQSGFWCQLTNPDGFLSKNRR